MNKKCCFPKLIAIWKLLNKTSLWCMIIYPDQNYRYQSFHTWLKFCTVVLSKSDKSAIFLQSPHSVFPTVYKTTRCFGLALLRGAHVSSIRGPSNTREGNTALMMKYNIKKSFFVSGAQRPWPKLSRGLYWLAVHVAHVNNMLPCRWLFGMLKCPHSHSMW